VIAGGSSGAGGWGGAGGSGRGAGGAGYSGTALPKKLGIKPGARVALARAPDAFDRTLGELPADVTVRRRISRGARFDVIVAFFSARAELARRLPALRDALEYSGGLWIAGPKRTSGVPTDVDENLVRELALESGLVDNKVCAIDETWSGLRLVYRLRDRPSY
jgi:hypothetical protein